MIEHVFARSELLPGSTVSTSDVAESGTVTVHLHILHLIRRRGPPPGVLGAESEGVWGNFANMSVSGGEPSPSGIE